MEKMTEGGRGAREKGEETGRQTEAENARQRNICPTTEIQEKPTVRQ